MSERLLCGNTKVEMTILGIVIAFRNDSGNWTKGTDGPLVDWAIGWLAHEEKIALRGDRNTVKVSIRYEWPQNTS
jgi:hypothetical protein